VKSSRIRPTSTDVAVGRNGDRIIRLVKDAAAGNGSTDLPRDESASRGGVLQRVASGDTDAFELVYRAYGAEVYALCLRMVGDSTEAQELVQDVFVRAWERRDSFRGESAFGSWLHRLAVNVVLERFRSDKRRDDRVTLQQDLTLSNAEATRGSPDDQLDIESSLSRLPRGARVAFVLHHVEGYSYEEIAELTHLAPATIRAHVFHARQMLMRMLS
jgi:RNA polymerase sigma-70 factor (ECF subfamily)